jgi:serine/threonine protein kinase
MIKVARDLPDSRAVRRELSILQLLHESEVPQWKHLPFVIDRFDAGGRIGAVLRSFPGPTLAAVRELPRYRSGVDQKHVMWIVDRLLSCLGYVHRLGVVHGTIDPSHVLIEPDTHNVCLTGWSFGVIAPARSGERILVPPGVFSAPEVQSGAIGPWTDIYSVGKLMIWLAGGAPGSTHVPTAVAEPIRELLRSMVEEDSSLRPHDAWALAEQFAQIKQQLWQGRFFPFQV